MHFNPAARLKRHVDDIVSRGQCSATELVDVLRRTRLLIEQGKVKSTYPTLSLYCDWIMHIELDRNPSGHEMICRLDKAMVDNRLSDRDAILSIAHALSLHELRTELTTLFRANNISSVLFDDQNNWIVFANSLVEELLERPVTFPIDVRTNPSAKGRAKFLKAVDYREQNFVRSDITTTAAFLTKRDGDGKERDVVHWELRSRTHEQGPYVALTGPLYLIEPVEE